MEPSTSAVAYPNYAGRRVLVTGGLGFIGSNLASHLSKSGAQVTLVDSLAPNGGGNRYNIFDIEGRVDVHIGDMGQHELIASLVRDVHYIFNLAASVSHVDSMDDPWLDLDSNCRAHLALLEACRKVNPGVKLVFTSTRQLYGRPAYLPVDEQHPVVPPDINAIHTWAAEQYHLLYQRIYGLPVVCLRLTNTYGPRQLIHHSRQSFIAWFIRNALEGGVIELFGGGGQLRDLNYVDDVVEALLLAGASNAGNGEVFNLGSGEPVSLAALAETLIAMTGRGSTITTPFPPDRERIDIGDFHASFAKIEHVLGWRPRTSLETGLRRTLAFYEEHRDRYLPAHADPVPRTVPRTSGD